MARRNLAKVIRNKTAFAIILYSGFSLSSCVHFLAPGPSRVASTDEAGTVRVAATTVALWADVSTSMKSNFALTGDQAAAQVLPTTESIEQEVLTALGAGIAAGFPQTTTSSSVGTSNGQQSQSSTAGGVTTTTATSNGGTTMTTTSQTQSGTPPVLPAGMPAGGVLPTAPGSAGSLGLDPVLRYKAANHLLQEVQLLNQEIADAADRKCYVPYVVGLKVSVINYRPHIAYSLHEHIGFFFRSRISTDEITNNGDAAHIEGPLPPTPSSDLAVDCRVSDLEPEVVPLLVTDDIQVAVKARAAEAAQQIASAVSFMVHGIGVGASLNAVKQSLESIQNHDLTSSLTIGRDTGSSIYVEVTPNNSASGDPSLVNQTYDIPVLLLVPRSYFGGAYDVAPVQLAVASYQQFRDSTSGKILPSRPARTIVQQGSNIVESYLLTENDRKVWTRLTDDQKAQVIKDLYSPAASGDMKGLVQELKAIRSLNGVDGCGSPVEGEFQPGPCFNFNQAPNLWTALGTLGDDASGSNSTLQLPLPAPLTVPSQEVLLSDDGQDPIQAVLGGVSGRSIANLAAQLRITPFDHIRGPGSEIDISAQTLTFDPVAHTLTLSFPSLKKLGIDCLSPTEQSSALVEPTPTNVSKSKPTDVGTCPLPVSGSRMTNSPNRIVLSLVGCNPQYQLCPDLTPTDVAADPLVAQRKAMLIKADQLFDLRLAQTEESKSAARAVTFALLKLKAARAKTRVATSPIEAKAAEASLNQAEEAVASATAAFALLLQEQLSPANPILMLNRLPEKPSVIGVTLVAAPNPTNPSKLKVGSGGTSICIQNGGVGTIYVTVGATPSGDTGALTVDGAPVVSTLDLSTHNPMPFGKTGYTFSKDGVFRIDLINLAANATVSVTAQAYSGTKPDGGPEKATYSTATTCSPVKITQH